MPRGFGGASRRRRVQSVAVALALLAVVADRALAAPHDTVLVDRATGAAGIKGNAPPSYPSVSADGRYVAFISAASNLSPDDPSWLAKHMGDVLTSLAANPLPLHPRARRRQQSIPIKYLLYTHYGYRDAADLSAWRSGASIADLAGVQFFADHLPGLEELLSSPAHEGVLVVFYAPGFADFLDGIAKGHSRDALLKLDEVAFASTVSQYVDSLLTTHRDLSTRVRFVTPIDLLDILGRLNWGGAQDLRWRFIGKKPGIRYDTPKIVEAFVRLRLLGTGVPVFRLDYDVLFRGDENKNTPDLGLFKTVASCLRAYRLRLEEPSVATFLFSASYDARGIISSQEDSTFSGWSRAFATRVFPALPVRRTEVAKVGTDQNGSPYTWDTYAAKVFDEQLARRFYGLRSTSLATDGVTGIGRIGAHPTASVISGAMLCLSEGAILDLPPFSNFSLNVSWIDDHLKYSLHRELRHLTTVELKVEPLLSDAKLDPIIVEKARGSISNLPEYVLGKYLPTLLWGAVMDAWITPHPLLKYRPEDLTPGDHEAWLKITRRGQSDGVLAAALQAALERGSFLMGERVALEQDLVKVGLARLSEVRNHWSELVSKDGDTVTETFASIWAGGRVESYFPELTDRCTGITQPQVPLTGPVTSKAQLNGHLHEDFDRLVDDALDYIEWTLEWPTIVQVVRSVEQGTVRTDMSWNP
jgi:hypothetical protein